MTSKSRTKLSTLLKTRGLSLILPTLLWSFVASPLRAQVETIGNGDKAVTLPVALPAEVTVNGVVLRLTRARWQLPPNNLNVYPKSSEWGRVNKSLYVSFQAAGKAPVTLPAGRTLESFVGSPFAYPPGELPVKGRIVKEKEGLAARFDDLDPHLKALSIRFSLRDPSAPQTSIGNFAQTLELHQVPIPRRVGETITVNQTVTASQGTKVVLENVALLADGKNNQNRVHFRINTQQPPLGVRAFLDTQAQFEVPFATDNQGVQWDNNNLEVSGPNDDNLPGRRKIAFPVITSPGALTFEVQIALREVVTPVAPRNLFRRFAFQLDLGGLPGLEAKTDFKPLAQMDTPTGKVSLDSLWRDEDGIKGRLAFTPASSALAAPAPDAPARRWVLGIWSAQSARGQELQTSSRKAVNWRANGAPTSPGESSQRFDVRANQARVPDSLDLRTLWEEETLAHHVVNWRGLVVPSLGEVVAPNQVWEDRGAQMELLKITAFDAEHPLATPDVLSPDLLQRQRTQVSSGLALDFRFKTARPARSRNLTWFIAEDDQGRMVESNGSSDGWFSPHMNSSNGDYFTVYLQRPATDAKTFHLRARFEETGLTGRHETALFSAVAIPQAEAPPPL